MKVVDFSFSRPAPSALVAAGVGAVIRYTCADPSKFITPQESRGYLAAGIAIALVHEDGVNDWVGGASVGIAKAREAAPTLQAIGFGQGRPVYGAVDMNLPAAQYAPTWEGLHAFADTLGRPAACYGPRPFLLWLEQTHGVEWLWELGSSSFNTGPEPRNKRLQQLVGRAAIAGCSVDWNTPLADDFGQWPAPKPPAPKPTPPKPPTPTEDNVQIHDYLVTAGANGQGSTTVPVQFGKVGSWSVEGGAGPHEILAECVAGPGNSTIITVKGAGPGQGVTVRLEVLA